MLAARPVLVFVSWVCLYVVVMHLSDFKAIDML